MGLSTTRFFPAISAAHARSKCVLVGEAITTNSISGSDKIASGWCHNNYARQITLHLFNAAGRDRLKIQTRNRPINGP